MKIHYLSNTIPWFGKYSGYDCIKNYLPDEGITLSNYVPKPGFLNKLIGKFYQKLYGWNSQKPTLICNQIKFLKSIGKSDVSHILYLEGNIHLLDKLDEVPEKLFGTIHMPFELWSQQNLERLAGMKNTIILYKEEIEKFRPYLKGNIWYLPHGVDIDFFKPSPQVAVNKNKVLFVGHFLRNFEMIRKVYDLIVAKHGTLIEFHFVIPELHRNTEVIQYLQKHENVFFHSNLSDEELLYQYQNSYVMLMPLTDSGANTAIVQAIAAGLPIITTDVGGIRSYGGGDVFELVENNDSEGMVKLFEQYYNDEAFRNKVAASERDFAVNELDWKKSALDHIKLYKKVI